MINIRTLTRVVQRFKSVFFINLIISDAHELSSKVRLKIVFCGINPLSNIDLTILFHNIAPVIGNFKRLPIFD